MLRFVSINRLPFRLVTLAGILCIISISIGWSEPEQVSSALDELGLIDGEIVEIQFGENPSKSRDISFRLDGNDYFLDYSFKSFRSSNFSLRVQQENGETVEVPAPPVRTIRGQLRGFEGSRFVGCILDSGMAGKMVMPDGRVLYVEPMKATPRNGLAEDHIFYSSKDLIPTEQRCGLDGAQLGNADAIEGGNTGPPIARMSSLRECEVTVDADFEYFTAFGSSTRDTLDRIELIFNIVNDQYESQVGIRHTISGATVWTTVDDPYTTSNDIELLREFSSFYRFSSANNIVDGDLFHLFTGKNLNFNGVTNFGIAYEANPISLERGVVCDPLHGYGVSRHQTSIAAITNTVAHELGHNWGLAHCTCPNHTMHPNQNSANDFSNASLTNVINYRDTLDLACLSQVFPPFNRKWLARESLFSNSFDIVQSNYNADTEEGEQHLTNVGSTVWWSFTPSVSGEATINTFGSSFDTQLHVYRSASSLPGLILVAENDDSSPGIVLQSEVNFAVTGGTRYDIRVGGYRMLGSISDGDEGLIFLKGTFPTILGDVNLDSVVDFSDIPTFIAVLTAGQFQDEADCDENGIVNFQDIPAFINILTNQ